MSDFLFFIGSLKKGGAERNTAILANHLTRVGHKVTIAVFVNEIAFDLDPRITVIRINHKRYNNSFLSLLYVIFKLRSLINLLKPKRLIAMSRIGSLIASSTFFSRTIVRFDIYPLIGYKKYKQWQFWLFYNLPWVKNVVCPSEELKEDVAHFFLNRKKLVTIYNPVSLPSKKKLQDVQNERPYFVIVSRLSSQKNIAEVIETYYRYQIFNKADLLILGDGPQMSHLKVLIENLKLIDYVKLKGFIGDPYPFMANAVALINASIREGFPNVVVESLSLSTPVISSLAKTGPKEIIFHGDNGYLFPVGDYEKLGHAMSEFLDNRDFYTHLKGNINKGLERFTQEKVMMSWEEILIN